MESSIIATKSAPAAIGPYSQAVAAGGFMFCSGQLGIDPATGQLAEGVRAQAEQSLRNVKAVLAAAGLGMASVVKTTIFLADMADFAVVNEVYAAAFADPGEGARAAFPARSTVQVAALPKGGRVEIEAIAVFSK
jgi:2-iminobutanoate/2-iminopropanoate deaminase